MSDKPISDLRSRMIADIRSERSATRTDYDYTRHLETFARLLRGSPDTATSNDIRHLQL